MSRLIQNLPKSLTVTILGLALLAAGCSPLSIPGVPGLAPEPAGQVAQVGAGTEVTIVEPAAGAQLQEGVLVDVHSTISDPQGASRASLLVNGQVLRDDLFSTPMHRGNLYQPWTPDECGPYTLQVRLAASGGRVVESDVVPVTVECVSAPPPTTIAPTPAFTPPPTMTTAPPPPTGAPVPATATRVPPTGTPLPPTFTPTTPPPPTIESFEADPPSVVLGECSTLRVAVVGVISSVWLDGESIEDHDSREKCPTATTTYTLRAVGPGGESTANVTVNVTGAPAQTPSPPPLSAPVALSPSGDISCFASMDVTLSWTQSTGNVDGYGWFVERAYSADGPWEQVENGYVEALSDTVNIVCGSAYYYRWAVAAVGEGGTGPSSEYAYFQAK